MRVLVRAEEAVLWARNQRRALLQPQHELAEPTSRRLLRECCAFTQMSSMLHAHPRGAACLSLGHQVLRVMPALTWGWLPFAFSGH